MIRISTSICAPLGQGYVDASTCRITYELSTTYPGLGWSYTTCGYRDLYSHENITQSLRNKTLRVAFLGNTGGWKGNFCEGAAGQLCMKQRGSGPVQRFFDILAGTAGFEIQQVRAMLWEKVRTVVVHIVHKQVWNRFYVFRVSTSIIFNNDVSSETHKNDKCMHAPCLLLSDFQVWR